MFRLVARRLDLQVEKEVAWGVVHGERGPGSHCGFTAGKVGKMDLARSYA